MRHRELLRPLPPIKQMHRERESNKSPSMLCSRGGTYCPMPLLQGRLAGTNPARVGSADQSPARGHVGGQERSV